MGSKTALQFTTPTTRIPGLGSVSPAEYKYAFNLFTSGYTTPIQALACIENLDDHAVAFTVYAHRDLLYSYQAFLTKSLDIETVVKTPEPYVFSFKDDLVCFNAPAHGKVRVALLPKPTVQDTTPRANAATLKLLELIKLIEDFANQHKIPQPKRVKCYLPGPHGDWRENANRSLRPVDSLFGVDETIKLFIVDIDAFYANLRKYERLGITPKRTFLLSGPPGSGKSSAIRAAASHYDWPLYFMTSPSKMTEPMLTQLVQSVPAKAFLVFEDIDRDGSTSAPSSALLSMLDGNYATHPRVTFLTTNFPGTLDQAVRRTGRIDREYNFQYAVPAQVDAAVRFAFAEEKSTLSTESFEALVKTAVTMFAAVDQPMTMSSVMEAIVRTLGCDSVQESIQSIDFHRVVAEKQPT